ncbi:MAG: hypothetical protein OHK0023_16360 [Anaerolineae bacterium]
MIQRLRLGAIAFCAAFQMIHSEAVRAQELADCLQVVSPQQVIIDLNTGQQLPDRRLPQIGSNATFSADGQTAAVWVDYSQQPDREISETW